MIQNGTGEGTGGSGAVRGCPTGWELDIVVPPAEGWGWEKGKGREGKGRRGDGVDFGILCFESEGELGGEGRDCGMGRWRWRGRGR
jgi:hypothetical protein